MVVNESALLRAMKEDYKGQGYTVARRFENLDETDDESILVLTSGDWLVEIEWKNVPSKVFGLIAQHLKGLPAVGEAFTVKKKETNTTIFAMVDKFPEIEKPPRLFRHTEPGSCMKIWKSGRKTGTTGVCSSRWKLRICCSTTGA